MKYTYCQNEHKAWLEYYTACTSFFCEPETCDCGMSFEQGKEWVVAFYEKKLEAAKNITEDNY